MTPHNNFHQTRYIRMVIDSDQLPWEYNIVASLAHWMLLAGYLVIPGTFTSLQKSDALKQGLVNDKTGEAILNTIQNPPLLATASVFFLIGCVIMLWLYWRFQHNYIWLMNRAFDNNHQYIHCKKWQLVNHGAFDFHSFKSVRGLLCCSYIHL
ncbi:hypothetical protein N7463_007481 [Penicillium fimorum]|uniref:Uncharacterized protein n=1 Tax=Penicillium fimorum TaxID=1882269 RepID=A0A9X0C760_9EURO|nr:hypothetical protein N7463_007481 [Penicillium fimorum]